MLHETGQTRGRAAWRDFCKPAGHPDAAFDASGDGELAGRDRQDVLARLDRIELDIVRRLTVRGDEINPLRATRYFRD